MVIALLYEISGTDKVQIRASDAVIETLFTGSPFFVNDNLNKNMNQGDFSHGRRHVLKRTSNSAPMMPGGTVTLHNLATPQEVLDWVSGNAQLVSSHYDREKRWSVYCFQA